MPTNRTAALFLLRRRQELLAPLRALIELTAALARDEAVIAAEDARADLAVIRRSVRELFARVRRELRPGRDDLEALARALGHDLRTPLAVIINYGDELGERADELGLADLRPDFEQIVGLGRRALALIDRSVAQLRSAELDGDAEKVEPYLERRQAGAGPARVEPSPRPGRILVAEDHEEIRAMICQYLTAMGHTVVAVSNGAEARAKLQNQDFNLVLTDIAMPVADGFELIQAIKGSEKEKLRDLPIVVLSAQDDLDQVVRCIALGAEDYLPKPFNAVILRARVESCLAKKRLNDQIKQERHRYKELFHSILPGPVADELSRTNAVRPVNRDGVAVLFADIVGFTTYCDVHQDRPEVVLDHLRRLFESWELECAKRRVQKIKTIGDAFMAAAGLGDESDNPVFDCVRLGLDMIRQTRDLCDERGRRLGFDLRVGVHVGPVVTGVLGWKQIAFDLWGDTVNVASRMESHGRPGCVNLSDAAWSFVDQRITGESRSTSLLKGKAEPMGLVHIDVDHHELTQF